MFDKVLKWDLNDGFPLLTTKKMYWKGIVEELLFFIRGDTQSKKLEEKGIKIWKANTCAEFLQMCNFNNYSEGEMGPMYGYQWRFFGKPYKKNSKEKGIDQLKQFINELRINPNSRRHLISSYNPQ